MRRVQRHTRPSGRSSQQYQDTHIWYRNTSLGQRCATRARSTPEGLSGKTLLDHIMRGIFPLCPFI